MKAGRILLFAVTFLFAAGALKTTNASDYFKNANICSSSLVSKATCINNEAGICLTPIPDKPLQQIQAAVVTLNPTSTSTDSTNTIPTAENQNNVELSPNAQTQMPLLHSAYASNSAILDSDKIFDLVNQYRESQGLTPFERDDKVCELAQVRSTEIPAEIAAKTLHSGLYNRNLPYWIFENAKYGSNEEGTVAWWLASPLHHKSIVADYKFSCVKCTGSYCSELFTSFVPK
jgi:uncharacterized protein YkwD